MALEVDGRTLTLPGPPVTSLFLTHPVNIIMTTNTFVRFHNEHGSEDIGLIVQLNAAERSVKMRLFLTWQQLVQLVGPDRVTNISFWPRRNSLKHPIFLCDSDIVVETSVSTIIGLAFVFHVDESVVRQLDGIRDTYCVSSLYFSQNHLIRHCRSFHSFPSSNLQFLPSCCPSMIFEQLMHVRNKVQQSLNTKAMRAKNVVTVNIENFNKLTWSYITRHLAGEGIDLLESFAVVKNVFMEKDALVVQKRRERQQSFTLFSPEHFVVARQIFGASAGLGIRVFVPCSLRKVPINEAAESSHTVRQGDTINVIPFVVDNTNAVQKGLTLKYIPTSGALTISIRFQRVHEADRIKPHFRLWGIPLEDDCTNSSATEEGDVWPLHSDTECNGHRIVSIFLNSNTVLLDNNHACSFEDVINDIRQRI